MNSSSTPSNNDVVIEILLHLPVKSLLKFRSVCKFWRDVIDSPSFRRLHNNNNNNNNNDDDTVYLQFTFLGVRDFKLSIKLLDNGKSLKACSDDFDFNDFKPSNRILDGDYVSFVGPIKGVFCFTNRQIKLPLAICNPFLGQIKILPICPITKCCDLFYRWDVRIGFHDEYYKVLQLLFCGKHSRRHRHAKLYSKATDSWRDLSNILDQEGEVDIDSPIDSLCKNGCFAYWRGRIRRVGGDVWEHIILIFDMKNEVFRTLTMVNCSTRNIDTSDSERIRVFAKDDEDSFVLLFFPCRYGYRDFDSNNKVVRIYESRCEGGGKLSWKHVVNVEEPSRGGIPLWRSDCVVFKRRGYKNKELVFYDYRARRFIGCFRLPENSEIFEYKGTFVSP